MKMTMWCDSLLRLCTIVALVVICTNGERSSKDNVYTQGYIMPRGDIVIEYGNPLEMYCVLNDDFVEKNGQYPSSRLSFLANLKPVPRETIDVINASTIRLYIEKPEPSQVVYICTLDNKKPLCASTVFVATKPKNVTDFRCISNNFDNLTCSWSYQEHYVKTTYELIYRFLGRGDHWSACPSPPEPDDKGIMSCFWNISTTPQYRNFHELFIFNLTVKNRYGINRRRIEFHHYQHVRPGPPERLKVLNRTSNSLFLKWRVPSSLLEFEPGVTHRVLYQCEYGSGEWKLAPTMYTTFRRVIMYYNLTGLSHPNALYNVRVSMISGAALRNDDSMWSANASISKRLLPDVPAAPPETTPGCFDIEMLNNHKSDIYVFWKHVPKKFQNGYHFHYNITILGEPHIRPEEITKTYAKFENMTLNKTYKFIIWSQNDNGSSKEASEVYVPRRIDRPMQPSSLKKIDYGGGKYELTWLVPNYFKEVHEVKNYTLFWCNSKKDWPYKCTGFLNWTTIPSTKTSEVIYVNNDDIYQFSISANSDGGISSGMSRADCTILYSKHTQSRMNNLYIYSVGETNIIVAGKLFCSDQIGSVKGFVVYYCITGNTPEGQQHCLHDRKSVTFFGDHSHSRWNLNGLERSTTYIITVSVLSKNDEESLESDMLLATTSRNWF